MNFKIERIESNEFSVTGEGVNATVIYYGEDSKVKGKGSRKLKAEIIAAVRELITKESEEKQKKKELEVEEKRTSFLQSEAYKNIELLALYEAELLYFDSYYGHWINNTELLTGLEVMEDSRIINAKKHIVNNTDIYSISVSDRMVKIDERLLKLNNYIFVTGLTLKEKLLTGLKSYGHIRKAVDHEIRMFNELGKKEKNTFIIGESFNLNQELQTAERLQKELKRAKEVTEEPKQPKEFTEEGKEIKFAFFSSKVFNFENIIKKEMATLEKYIVAESITIDQETFEKFITSFDMSILNTSFKGGTNSTYEPKEDVSDFYQLSEEEQSKYIEGSYRLALEVKIEGKDFSLLIDPQGFDYARYIAVQGEYTPEKEEENKEVLKAEEAQETSINFEEAGNNEEAATQEIQAEKEVNNACEGVTYQLNDELNGIEIYFAEKPNEEIREQLKANKFRWSRNKKCWYAKQNNDTLSLAKQLAGKEEQKEEAQTAVNSFPSIEINDCNTYTIDQSLQDREHDSNWIFRTKKTDHNKEIQSLFEYYTEKTKEVIEGMQNEYYAYKAKEALQRFKKKYHSTYVAYLTHKSNNPSWAVTGRGNLNVNRYNKAMNRQDKLMLEVANLPKEFEDKLSYYANKDRKRQEKELKQQLETELNQPLPDLKFQTVSKEFDLYGNGRMIKTRFYECGNYSTAKVWGAFRVYDKRTGKEVYSTKSNGTLKEAKAYIALQIKKDRNSKKEAV